MNRRRIDHYLVAGTNWGECEPLMRRNRLALFLQGQPSTGRVYWFGITEIGVRSCLRQYREMLANTRELGNGVQQISLPDVRGWLRYSGFLNPVVRWRAAPFLSYSSPRCLWYTNPSYAPVTRMGRWDRVIYDCSDYWNRPPTARRKLRSEQTIAGRADLLFGSSEFLVELLQREFDREAVLVENGVDYPAFATAEAADLGSIPRPRLGFIGALKRIVDYRLLAELLRRFDRASLVLVGQVVDTRNPALVELLGQERVYHLPPVPSSEVPRYMKALDVGLCPYRVDDAFSAGGFPIKFFEYLAAGLPVVGHGQPATKKYTEQGVYHYGENYVEFFDLVHSALAAKEDPDLIRRRQDLASRHDWSTKFNVMLRSAIAAPGKGD